MRPGLRVKLRGDMREETFGGFSGGSVTGVVLEVELEAGLD